jgi:hypothetical protein
MAKQFNESEIMYQDYYEIDGNSADTLEHSPYEPSYGWIKRVLFVLSIILFIAIIFSVKAEHIVMCLLAYLNCLFMSFGLWWFLRKKTIAAMVPMLFIPMNLMGWPVPILYFAIFYPDGYYPTLSGEVSYFDAGIKLQLCVMLFFIGYFAVMFWALRKEQPTEGGAIIHPGRLAFLSVLLGAPIVLLSAVSKIVSLPGTVAYLAEGLFNSLNGLFFIAGALIKNISKIIKWLFFSFIAVAVFFYTVGNARGMAVSCVFPIVLGVLFFSSISRKTKIALTVSIFFAFPMYITIANTTRAILGTVGFEEGFGYRLNVLKEWRSIKSETPAVAFTVGRLFYTGGHSIIAQTPSRVPYLPFSPVRYFRELLENLIPGTIYYNPYYRDIRLLIDYGFVITEKTSVNLSMIGSFWLLGGYLPVFFGGVAVGLLHWVLIIILRRSWAVSKAKAFVFFSVLAPKIIWAPRISLIEHWHIFIYNIVIASVIYLIIKVLIGDYGVMAYSDESYSLLQE